MNIRYATTLRARLTFWYIGVLAVLLLLYAALVFAFQYELLTRQMFHDEVQDVVTVEGLLYFDAQGQLQLRQDYYSRPQSHLLVDRIMEVREIGTGAVLYRSPTLHGMSLDGPLRLGEGDRSFNERAVVLADGTHVFMVSHFHGMNGRMLVLRLGYDLGPLHHRMLQFVGLLLLGIPIALLVAGFAGRIIARRALSPLDRMTRRAAGITARNLQDRLDVTNPNDEMGQMAGVFNGLLGRLEDAFVQLQRFTSDAAHELRTPLAAIRAMSEVSLQSPRSAESYRSTLSDILEETGHLNETIESLLLLSRAEAMQPGNDRTSFQIGPLVEEVLTLLDVMLEERAIRVLEQGDAIGAAIFGERTLLRVAVLNILHNAIKFSPRDSVITISYTISDDPQRVLQIAFQDQGPGIPRGEEHLVFGRFFISSNQASAPNSGTGLGLAITKLIIERSGGIISFDNTIHQGARCIVSLPVSR
jgi:signal transduction histidine kinase